MKPASRVCIALGLFSLLFSSGWILSQDATARLAVTRQLWSHGTVFLAGTRPERFVRTPWGRTTYFGIGQTLAFIPFDAMGSVFGRHLSFSSRMPETWRRHLEILPLLLLYLPGVAMAWCGAVYALARALGEPRRESAIVSTAFSLTTIAWVYQSQSFQEEAIVGALVTAALAGALRWRASPSRRGATGIGALAGMALLFRLNAIFALLPTALVLFGGWGQREARRSLPGVVLGALPAALLFTLFAYWRFGHPFSTGYDRLYRDLRASGVEPLRGVEPAVAWALLFGVGKGLFPLSPPLLLAFPGLRRRGRERPALWIGVALATLGSALFHSRLNGFSCGGQSWGARFQVHLVGLWSVPALWGAREFRRTRLGSAIVLALLTLGAGVQWAGVIAPESVEYLQLLRARGGYHEELVTGIGDGQLPLRVKNLWSWIARPRSRPFDVPNLWVTSYAKEFGIDLRPLLLLWAAGCLGALLLLLQALSVL